MDQASYCVYNATRNALLSERVISVCDPQTPAQLLALVMNGPGRDPHFCIRLNNVSVTPEIPRLFAFDVAYLDSEQRIVATADVGPGTPFPPIREEVTTILFLSDQLLPNSKSEPGDMIRICTGGEIAALLRAAAHFQAIDSPVHRVESAIPQTTPDPFDGSLVYLPASGVPQTREMFVPPLVRSSELIDPFASAMADLEISAAQVAEESSPPFGDSQETSEEAGRVATLQPEPSLPEITSPVRFFENPSKTSSAALDGQAQQSPQPSPSQLPFNLRAVIQLVDEQLRREQEQEEQAPNLQEHNRPADDALPLVDASASDQPAPPLFEAPPEITLTAGPEITAAVTPATEGPEIESSPVFQIEQTPEPVMLTAPPPPLLASPEARADAPLPAEELPLPPLEPAPTIRIPVKEKLPFAARVQRWLAGDSISLSGNRRRGERIALPGLVAFYFTGGAPKPHEIVNISSSGLYLRSKELWSPNTLVRMTIERQDPELGEKKSISVLARVVRVDEGGIGHEFVTTEVLARLHARDFLPQQGTNRKELEKFLANSR